jgi:hypothetical protein
VSFCRWGHYFFIYLCLFSFFLVSPPPCLFSLFSSLLFSFLAKISMPCDDGLIFLSNPESLAIVRLKVRIFSQSSLLQSSSDRKPAVALTQRAVWHTPCSPGQWGLCDGGIHPQPQVCLQSLDPPAPFSAFPLARPKKAPRPVCSSRLTGPFRGTWTFLKSHISSSRPSRQDVNVVVPALGHTACVSPKHASQRTNQRQPWLHILQQPRASGGVMNIGLIVMRRRTVSINKRNVKSCSMQ